MLYQLQDFDLRVNQIAGNIELALKPALLKDPKFLKKLKKLSPQ